MSRSQSLPVTSQFSKLCREQGTSPCCSTNPTISVNNSGHPNCSRSTGAIKSSKSIALFLRSHFRFSSSRSSVARYILYNHQLCITEWRNGTYVSPDFGGRLFASSRLRCTSGISYGCWSDDDAICSSNSRPVVNRCSIR